MKKKTTKIAITFIAIVLISLFLSSPSTAQETDKPHLKIVQLGDSYSAGNGARSDSGFRNYYGVSGCHRSPTNWGEQYVNSLKDEFNVEYINRACSGGIIADITKPRDMKDLLGYTAIDGECPYILRFPGEEVYKLDPDHKNICTRYLQPQIKALDHSVDLVLMSAGGNDAKFADIVTQCYTVFRDPKSCEAAVDFANDQLETIGDNLHDTLLEMATDLRDDAKVVLVSYPYLSTDTYLEIYNDDGRYEVAHNVRVLGKKADEIQHAAVDKVNAELGREFVIYYGDTKDLFAGHEPDPSGYSQNSGRWLHECETGVLFTYEWYHPNPLGHAHWANELSKRGSFGATGGLFGSDSDVDIAFVVDTTGSMGGDIAQVRDNLSALVDQLADTTNSYRVAVVSYRDYPERTGDSEDYPSKVIQTFTDDPELLQSAIDSLTLGYGGDWEETVFSGMQAALELFWRPGVTKVMLVIGDAPALSPEPISGLTVDQIISNSIALDPVQVVGVDTSGLNYNGVLGDISAGTGGSVVSGSSGLTATISEVIDDATTQPFAWFGVAYAGKIGEPIQFDASGSYDPLGPPIALYEWDFNGDGIYDLTTTEAIVSHVYNTAFDDYAVLRVTGSDGTGLASARVEINANGYTSQGDETPCELDENGYSIIIDEDGQFIRCTADSLPDPDDTGVKEITPTITFSDVPATDWGWRYIEAFYDHGITTGCRTSPLAYCPDDNVTRAEMAVFLERALGTFAPSTATLTFTDTAGHWAQYWIEKFRTDGLTTGCGPNSYCPNQYVTRAEMAVFIERSLGTFVPPVISPLSFTDTAGHWAQYWIEEFRADGITTGCGTNIYCPDQYVTRREMAVFISRAFDYTSP